MPQRRHERGRLQADGDEGEHAGDDRGEEGPTKFSEIKKQHPELVVGGFTLAVALPSALARRRAFFRNGARALVLSSALVHGGAWMKRRGAATAVMHRSSRSHRARNVYGKSERGSGWDPGRGGRGGHYGLLSREEIVCWWGRWRDGGRGGAGDVLPA